MAVDHAYIENSRERMKPFYEDIRTLCDTLDAVLSYKISSNVLELTAMESIYLTDSEKKNKVMAAIGTLKKYKGLLDNDNKEYRFCHYKDERVLKELIGALGVIKSGLLKDLQNLAMKKYKDTLYPQYKGGSISFETWKKDLEKHTDEVKTNGTSEDERVLSFYGQLLEKQVDTLYGKVAYIMNEFILYENSSPTNETIRKIESDILQDKETKVS